MGEHRETPSSTSEADVSPGTPRRVSIRSTDLYEYYVALKRQPDNDAPGPPITVTVEVLSD